ncbi:MAG: glycosyltransferase family 9 protein [Rhodospirillaceae bacterium]|nr:glycosyltransferase family 9 protein [Rhodospirillaceae bacterium]
MTGAAADYVLVILSSGVGAAVLSLGALAVLRRHHAGARIVAVAGPDNAAFVGATPFVDEVIVDGGAPWWKLPDILRLRRVLTAHAYARVYDLSDGARSELLMRALYGWPLGANRRARLPWSGGAAGTALSHTHPNRAAMHLIDRLADQLKSAGVVEPAPPELAWVARQVQSFTTPFRMSAPYVLLGADPGPRGAWPAATVAATAEWVAANGLIPVLAGLHPQPRLAETVREAAPSAVDITGQAPVGDLVFLAWGADMAIGPDSGLMTLVATAGCRSVILCDAGSDPALHGPRGTHIAFVRRNALADVRLGEVVALVGARLRANAATGAAGAMPDPHPGGERARSGA